MKTSCFGSRIFCSSRKALRAAATSGRSCSAACGLFFKGQVDVVEEPGNPRLAHLHLFFRQANLKLCKRILSPSELEALQAYYPVVPLQAPSPDLCVAQA